MGLYATMVKHLKKFQSKDSAHLMLLEKLLKMKQDIYGLGLTMDS